MTYVALAALLVVLILIAALVLERRRSDDVLLEQQRVAAAERRELLTRIQRPDLVPIAKPRQPVAQGARATDELTQVGRFVPREASETPSG